MAQAQAADVSQEHFGGGHVPSRPIAWVVVAIIIVGTIVGGVALIVAQPWLFYVGAAIIVIGAIIGCATRAMVDTRPKVTTSARPASSRESLEGQ